MRIAFLTPSVGEAFGQEQVLHESVRLLESVGHQCLVISEAKLGVVPSHINLKLCPDLSLVNSLSSRKFVFEKHNQVLQYLSEFNPDIVHYVDLFDYRLINEISEKYASVLTAHSVSHTCPASHRLIKNNRSCTAPSGWGCLVTDFSEECLSHFKSPLHKIHGVQNFLLKKEIVSRRFKKLIAISGFMKTVLIRDGYDPNQIEVIYNPVKEQLGSPVVGKKRNLIVCAARLVPLKGVDHFIKALSQLTNLDFEAYIFGDGPEREKLELLVKKLSLTEKIHFKGKMPRLDLQKAILEAKLLVQTNLGPEGFGLSVAESMLLGTPVIAYDIPALNELVLDGKTGFLCGVGDTETLALSIKQLLQDEVLCHSFSVNSMARARSLFSCQQFIEKTEKVYRSVLGLETSTDSKILSSSFR